MLLDEPPSPDDEHELRQAPIPPHMLKLLGWMRGLRLVVQQGGPPMVKIFVGAVLAYRVFSGEVPGVEELEQIKALLGV